MKELDVVKCQIQEWYPRFRGETFRTIVQILPENFVDYLLEDGLFLPASSEAMPTRTVVTCPQLQSEDYHRWEEEDDDEGESEGPTFPELEESVRASIDKLGGAVIPKLNWSAPKDASWISTSGTLRCNNFGEICLIMKASDNVAHDLMHAFDCCDDKTRDRPETVVLALRKWTDLRPEREFRAFVFGGVLVGISQREVTGFYPSLLTSKALLEFAIAEFFFRSVRGRFDAENYTFDCYVTTKGTVKLLDFNPWAGSTLPLLFSWEELLENYEEVLSKVTRNRSTHEEVPELENVGSRLEAVTLVPVGGVSSSCDQRATENGSADQNTGNGISSLSAGIARESHQDGSSNRVEYRVELRIVTSEGLVQPGIRIGTGVPIDFVDKGNWEVFRREAAEELQRDQEAENCA